MKPFSLPSRLVLCTCSTFIVITLFGCSKRSETSSDQSSSPSSTFSSSPASSQSSKNGYYAAADSTSVAANASSAMTSSSAARAFTGDTSKKFIRTADLKFKVNHAAEATYKIEDLTAHHHGFVQFTNLESTVDNRTTVTVSEDSSLVTTYYTMQNQMTIRVPEAELDSMLKDLAPLVAFLDHRVVTAEDVSIRTLANQIESQRLNGSAQRVANAIEKHGKKLGEVTNAEDQLLSRQEQADQAKLDNLLMADSMRYSVIQLSIYQRQELAHELAPNDKSIRAYKPGLFHQLGEALQYGWNMLVDIIIDIVRMWGLILFLVGIALLIRWFIRTNSGSQSKNNLDNTEE